MAERFAKSIAKRIPVHERAAAVERFTRATGIAVEEKKGVKEKKDKNVEAADRAAKKPRLSELSVDGSANSSSGDYEDMTTTTPKATGSGPVVAGGLSAKATSSATASEMLLRPN